MSEEETKIETEEETVATPAEEATTEEAPVAEGEIVEETPSEDQVV